MLSFELEENRHPSNSKDWTHYSTSQEKTGGQTDIPIFCLKCPKISEPYSTPSQGTGSFVRPEDTQAFIGILPQCHLWSGLHIHRIS